MAKTDPILDIETLIARPVIAIDGKKYEMLSPAELSLQQSHMFARWAKRMEALQASDSDIDDEMAVIVGQIVQLVVVDLPEEVFAKLSEEHRLEISQVFTGLLLRKRLGTAEATAMAMGQMAGSLPTGARSSRSSSGSMAGRLLTGWFGRLWRW